MSAETRSRIVIAFIIGLIATPAWAGQLHQFVRDGDVSSARRLIAAGADVEAQDEAALTPIVIAALAGQKASVTLLIESGADPRGRDGNGFTALHAAAHAGHLDVVVQLIDQGLDIDDQENIAGITPLHAAAERGFGEIAGVLLSRGADVHGKSRTGHTPVVMAVLNAHAGMVKLLRDHGADCTKIKLPRYRDYCMNAGE